MYDVYLGFLTITIDLIWTFCKHEFILITNIDALNYFLSFAVDNTTQLQKIMAIAITITQT